jgi:LacI family transcriptional regulator
LGSSVTIKDVARQANVSVATVSRALNGHENVADAVRTRVLAVARGIDQVARDHGQHLLVSSYHGNPQEQGEALGAMRGRVDGLLVMSPYAVDASPLANHLGQAQPAVLINSSLPDLDAPTLTVDNRTAAAEMVQHLAETGRRRIAYIDGPADNFDARDRLRGYEKGLAAAMLGMRPWVVQGDFSEASGHHAAQELLSAPQRPDAVFAANDMMALGFMFACQQAGVHVPEQIAVAGFDDIPLARYTNPSLTTMRVDIAGLGAQAMRMLLQQLSGDARNAVASEFLAARLITRKSTQPRNA